MHEFLVLSGLLIMVCAFKKKYHNLNGDLIIYIGLFSNLILSSFEINRLKKSSKNLIIAEL